MPETHITKNYFTRGGDELVIGGKLTFAEGAELAGAGIMPNQAAATGTSGTNAITAINDLLIKLKDSGLMEGDAFSLTVANSVNDTVAGHANRTYNTGKISAVAESNGVITITLSDKVKNLKDFDAGNGWGVHKWLGIAVSAGVSPITGLIYNGSALTAADVEEATAMGLSAGYFVRWVAADLVLAGATTQKSVDTFTLKASGKKETTYKIRIVEPE